MNIFFYWSGQEFDFGNYLAVASAACRTPGSNVVVVVDERPVDNVHFSRIERLPGVTLEPLDLESLVSPELRLLYGRMRFVAHRSDLVRLALLAKYGGVYLDTDTLTVADLSGTPEVLLLDDGKIVHLGCMALPAGHPVLAATLAVLEEMPEVDLDVYQSIIYYWTRVVRAHSPAVEFGDLHAYFPVHWKSWERVFTERWPLEGIRVLHHYGYHSRRYTRAMDEEWIRRNDCLFSDLARPLLRDLHGLDR
ncbi:MULTISPECIES: glycosyltransferase [unclassified Streptomyces]|uniref:glycosyltransferase n=1 Tax=unclassified Streptomyces TaxID=2593676 RepID=UPI002DDAC5F7|nr:MULTISPECIES: glycosyltransferase [unclassified Streptomyces]WSA94667.1 glycosyltransferase [Streptomyces sp. NBC_01795]WSB79086.1 glycosyltransferase [Streptomyces sp. NBC_01775]WSS41496.1 glycosyltransferase [Streptomyces sp. NBC_01187]